MSSQQRLIRPYVGLAGLETIFGELRIRVGAHSVEPGRSLHLGPDEFSRARVDLELVGSEDLWPIALEGLTLQIATLGLVPDDVELVVIASTGYLKMADVVVRRPLGELGADDRRLAISTPTRPRALRAVQHGASIDAYLCLAHDVEPLPLRPSRAGTWLARADFRISTDFDAIGFRPLPLTEDERRRLQLPTGTVRYIEVADDLRADLRADDAVELWVDADLLNRMSVDSKSAASRAFQIQLFLDSIAAVAEQARRDLGSECPLEDVSETFIGRMIGALAGSSASTATQQRLLDLMCAAPSRFLAYVEARTGFAAELRRTMEDDE